MQNRRRSLCSPHTSNNCTRTRAHSINAYDLRMISRARRRLGNKRTNEFMQEEDETGWIVQTQGKGKTAQRDVEAGHA